MADHRAPSPEPRTRHEDVEQARRHVVRLRSATAGLVDEVGDRRLLVEPQRTTDRLVHLGGEAVLLLDLDDQHRREDHDPDRVRAVGRGDLVQPVLDVVGRLPRVEHRHPEQPQHADECRIHRFHDGVAARRRPALRPPRSQEPLRAGPRGPLLRRGPWPGRTVVRRFTHDRHLVPSVVEVQAMSDSAGRRGVREFGDEHDESDHRSRPVPPGVADSCTTSPSRCACCRRSVGMRRCATTSSPAARRRCRHRPTPRSTRTRCSTASPRPSACSGPGHVVDDWLEREANAIESTALMLSSLGTPAFHAYSRQLYGVPEAATAIRSGHATRAGHADPGTPRRTQGRAPDAPAGPFQVRRGGGRRV